MKGDMFRRIIGRIHRTVLDFLQVSLRKLEKQEYLIHGGDWDILVILDACRYDYFEKEYSDFVSGKLKRVRSPVSKTFPWLCTIFNKWHNITVYSAHPVLNSLGVEKGGYKALPHFKKIIDVWRWGWDEELSTVPPKAVNDTVFEDIKRGAFKGKNIIWYIQPHAPWIGKTRLTGSGEHPSDKASILPTMVSYTEIQRKIRTGELSKRKLREAYRDNLRLVLQSVSELIPHLSGKVVITSDHGELLGELGLLGHPANRKSRVLREVPWLEIEK